MYDALVFVVIKDKRSLRSVFPTACHGEIEHVTDSRLGDQDGNAGDNEGKDDLAINRVTAKLDWVLGDDPSQVAIPGSPSPRNDKPAFEIPSTVQEAPEFMLATNLWKPGEVTPNRPTIATWPRLRRLFDGRNTPERNMSIESFISGSTSNGLYSGVTKSSSETLDSNLPKCSKSTVTQGTQTECDVIPVTVQTTVLEGKRNGTSPVVC